MITRLEIKPLITLLLLMFTLGSSFGQEEEPPYIPEEDPTNLPFPIVDDEDNEVETDYDWPVRELPTIDPELLEELTAEEKDVRKENNQYLKLLYKETTKKTYSALLQQFVPDATYLVCEVFSFPFVYGKITDKENKIYSDPYQQYVNTLLPIDPEERDQYIVTETMFNMELLRDINQVVAYTKQAMDYGLGMVAENETVMDRLSPERIYKREDRLFTPEEEEEVEDLTYNGMTQEQFTASVQNTIAQMEGLELTGDSVADSAAMAEVLSGLGEEENREEMTAIMEQIMSDGGYSEEISDEELAIIVSDVVEDNWEVLLGPIASGRLHLQSLESGMVKDLESEGLKERNIRERYGEAAEPFYGAYESELEQNNTDAKDILTKAINGWVQVQEKKYIEKAIAMEKIGREIIANGDSYVDQYKNISSEGEVMEKVLELIKLIGSDQ